VTLYNFNTNNRDLITSFTDKLTGKLKNDASFSIDSAGLMNGGPLKSSFDGPSHLVWAFYYPWWGTPKLSWNDPRFNDTPLLGPYHSADEATILAHIHMAKSAGIDGFIVSWEPYDSQNAFMRTILKLGAQENFKITIYFESVSTFTPDDQGLLQMFRTFFSNFENDPGYFKWNGRPVIFVYAVDKRPLAVWTNTFQTLKSEGHDAFYVAESDNANATYLQAFEGIHIYECTTLSKLQNLNMTYRQLQLSTRSFSLLHSDVTGGKLWAATVTPGYDERLLPGRTGKYLPRNDGDTFLKTFNTALVSGPDWILITSFNEWFEKSNIEPSVMYGFEYLSLTDQFSAQFKGQESTYLYVGRRPSTNSSLSVTSIAMAGELPLPASMAPYGIPLVSNAPSAQVTGPSRSSNIAKKSV
jgi:hypothetical protein